ncbi:DegT/DnrJ/EryC1/StrS family aminotransferase [Hydrogenophilus thermoluteolus]|uniref:dTDP-4-dehydro-6-deoxyglucose aminotransferase n=1 Tax=Hydrogenophilus thermoluteolus TaxID=297 RepID=A0A2Z6DYZ6_HYDTE|nr:DegT/DnrJ/EryC1/StrS family aminotransferase [Hydrogenophilus thermoluteolus]BBD77741.1 dTDP-4-dehydro-6-deoxyglucose aminotransferase [Hydrogenophilus thermoluteolus]
MKKIGKKKDLAIFGASPAFQEPIHVGYPNIGNKELFLKLADKILDSRRFTNNGPLVQELEQRISKYLGVKHCIALCNGTIALEIAIRALELKGEVIVPSFTFIATAHALSWLGLTPVFADIDPKTHCLDPNSVRSMITPQTSGILAVHLWGRPCDIEALQEIAECYNLELLFDAAHAFGCSYRGTMIGNFGRCEVVSFHATKFFNTFEGGAILTNDDQLADKIRLIRNFGFTGYDQVDHIGTNGKLPEISAAMGISNLMAINDLIRTNQRNYNLYLRYLEDIPFISMIRYNSVEHNNYQYIVIEVDEQSPTTRDDIIKILHAENILARKYFWPGCHNMKPYRNLYIDANRFLKNTNDVAKRVIVLPNGYHLSESMIETICSVIKIATSNKIF